MIRSHHFSAILPAQANILTATGAELIALLKSIVTEAELTAVGDVAVTFEPQGVSVVVVLEESHVALHVWTECRKVTIDIHVCDYQQDNRPKAERLAELLTIAMTGANDPSYWHYLVATA